MTLDIIAGTEAKHWAPTGVSNVLGARVGIHESDPSKGQLNESHNSLRLIKPVVAVNKCI